MVVCPRPRLGWVEMAVGFPEGPSYPGHSPFIFSLCCHLTAEGQPTASSNSVACFLFLSSLARLRLLILILLLMSGNVHANPGPIFHCSVCAGNETWRGKSNVMLHLLQMGLSKVLTTFPLQIQNSWQFSLSDLPLCCVPTCNTVTPSSDSSDRYTSTAQSGPPLLMLHCRPILVFKLLIPRLPILYLLPLPPHHRPTLLVVLLRLLLPLPRTLAGFFNGMLEVFEPGALNYFTFFCPILLILSVFRNAILNIFLFPNSWILCSAFRSHLLPVWHSLS